MKSFKIGKPGIKMPKVKVPKGLGARLSRSNKAVGAAKKRVDTWARKLKV